MVWQIAGAVAAAAGLLTLAWLWVGALLLPLKGQQVSVIYRGRDDAADLEQTVRSFLWLHETGLLRTALTIEDDGMDENACRRAKALAREHPCIRWTGREQTEQTRCEVGSTAGDDPGQRVRGDLSE